ncbi:NAD-dependent succinate-semialdehyde dehydrogenase [Streptomyces canus]|uniref:NAD-dependent succinate-semialdehyde dehydrogenase n=1 Tax=Streptomyces canus TaxID=58343 RepID=UPI00371F8A8B
MSTTTAVAVSVNPATDAVIAEYPFVDRAELEAVVGRTEEGFRTWRTVTPADRCAALARMANLLRRDRDRLAGLLGAEMGKPITQARAEVEKAANALDWYATHGEGMLVQAPVDTGAHTYVRHLPLGIVLAIEPWNFPVWQVMRGAAGIVLGGNAYLLKPAPNVVGSALALEALWREAGLPEGTFSVLNAEPDLVSAAIAHPAVAGVTVTGGVKAGSAIAAQAGREIKRTVLELGGADAFIALADADLDAAVDAAVIGRFQNAGQICIAAKRIILERPIAEEFTQRFLAQAAALTVGDPRDEKTYIGPIARADLRDEITRQVRQTVTDGGRLLLGGEPIDGPGNFFPPTVIDGVRPGMTAFDEEIFGPVAALVTVENADEAVALANLSPFGLSASVWTRDTERAARLADVLEVGGVFVNKLPVSDPRIPIGGVKNSGYGRELSHYGVHEFTNIQAVWIEQPEQ